MKLMLLSSCLLLWLLCLQQYCFLTSVEAITIGHYNDTCNTTQQCDPQNLTCVNGLCKCQPGFYLNVNSTCLLRLRYDDNCSTTDQCPSQNFICEDNRCKCAPGFYFDGSNTCLPRLRYDDNCSTTDQCPSQNFTCEDNRCKCAPGFYFDGSNTCLPQLVLSEPCNDTIECLGDNVECNKNYCTCNDQHYQDGDICNKKHALSDSCNETDECLGDVVECLNNVCTCNDQYYDDGYTCIEKHALSDSCNETDECLGDVVECLNNVCTCNDQYYKDGDTCFQKHRLWESCKESNECYGENVECIENSCQCTDQYYGDNFICKKKKDLFSSCYDTNECSGDNVECIYNVCNCSTQYFYADGKCKGRLEPGSSCKYDRMCSMLSVCKDQKCVCRNDHYLVNKSCFLKNRYGETCEKGSCLEANMYCDHKCTCKDDYEYLDSVCRKKQSNTVIIIVILLIIILLGLLTYILWKIKKQTTDEFTPQNQVTQVELTIPTSKPILMSKFPETVDLMHQNENKIFTENFTDLGRINPLIMPEDSTLRTPTAKYLPCHEAKKSSNASKNRFLDILPFDHSRVKLNPVDDDVFSEYINASYISGYNRAKEYIAAQGPLPNTSSDFWRMAWQEDVSVIVMLTLCQEKEMNKCDNYWPVSEGDYLDYDDLTVETTNVTNFDSYDCRNITLRIDDYSHFLKHFHFLQWADFSANVPVEILINFVRNVRSHITTSAPVIVHCSAGVGRTGTFIAVDYLLQFVDANPLDSDIDIFQFVYKMRNSRVHMVQNKHQYILIHDCIKHLVKRKIALETGDLDDENEANPYENEGFVTVDLTDVGTNEKPPQDSGSITVDITNIETNEKPTQDSGSKEKINEESKKNDDYELVNLEENPYENEMHGVNSAEKDSTDLSDENPYDIPENTLLISKNSEDKELEDTNKEPKTEVNAVTREDEEAEENPYENQDFGDSDLKPVTLT